MKNLTVRSCNRRLLSAVLELSNQQRCCTAIHHFDSYRHYCSNRIASSAVSNHSVSQPQPKATTFSSSIAINNNSQQQQKTTNKTVYPQRLIDASEAYLQHAVQRSTTAMQQQQQACNLILQWLKYCDTAPGHRRWNHKQQPNNIIKTVELSPALEYATAILRTLQLSPSTSSTTNVQLLQTIFHRVLWHHVKPYNYKTVVVLVDEFSHLMTIKGYSMAYSSLQLYCTTNSNAAQLSKRYCQRWMKSQQQLTVQKFKETTKSIVQINHLVAQNSYLHILAHCSRFDISLPQQIEDYVWRLPISNGKSHVAVLLAWVNAAQATRHPYMYYVNKICMYHDRIRSERNVHHRYCYNICINALGKASTADTTRQAEALLWKMHDHAQKQQQDSSSSSKKQQQQQHDEEVLQIDDYTIIALLNAYAKNSEPDKALNLLQQISHHHDTSTMLPKPTIGMYTAVMDAYARQVPSSTSIAEKVERILFGLEQLYTTTAGDSALLKPTREMYNIAIRAWTNATTISSKSTPRRAMQLVERMIQQNHGSMLLLPCNITYTSVIQAWGNTKSKIGGTNALLLYRQMERHNTKEKTTVASTCTTQTGIFDDDDELALPILPSACRMRPNTVTLNTVLQALTTGGLVQEAHDLLLEASQRLVENDDSNGIVLPDSKSWAIVAHGYVLLMKSKHYTHRNDSSSSESDSKHTRYKLKEPQHTRLLETHQLLHELETLYTHTKDSTLQPTTGFYATVLYSYKDICVKTAAELFWRVVHQSKTTTAKQGETLEYDTLTDQSLSAAPPPTEPDTFLCNTMLNVWAKNSSKDPMAPQRCEELYMWMMKTASKHGAAVQPNAKSIKYVEQAWNRSRRQNAPYRIKQFLNKIKNTTNTV